MNMMVYENLGLDATCGLQFITLAVLMYFWCLKTCCRTLVKSDTVMVANRHLNTIGYVV